MRVKRRMKRDATSLVLIPLFVILLAALLMGGPMMGWGVMGWGAMARGMIGSGMMSGNYVFSAVAGIVTFLLSRLAIAALIVLIVWLVGELTSPRQSNS